MFLLLYGWPGRCEIRDVLKSGEIDSLFAKTETSTDVTVKSNYIISLRVQSGPGSWVTHFDEDEIWLVRHGSAKLSLGTATLGAGVRRSADDNYDVGAGDVVNIPRTMAYQLLPGTRFEYIVVQIFPTERRPQPGRVVTDRPMPHVVPNATIQETFAKNTTNQPLHTMGAAGMNHVIYMGAPGPYEVHLGCDDLYFVRLGNAVAQVDGHVVNPTEASPGEIRGTGAFGFREYKIGVGDILVIPRNTMHHMDPGSEKLGYLLLKVYQ
jgi:mannose-6-phosphate isomerase-like protein (cupin superfamily)